MDKFAFQEHVLDAQWMSIHGPANNTINEPFFLNNKVAQHVKKMKFFRALFRGDLEPTLQVDFSHPSANGEERESRLRRWSEELWQLVNENSKGSIFDRVTKRSHDVIDEICEHNGGHSSNYCTRFGWFNTFRAPGPARQGLCVQNEEFGQPFLDIQQEWFKKEQLLREAEEAARRLIDEERKRTEATTRAAEVAEVAPVAPVVGQPVAAVAEAVVAKTAVEKEVVFESDEEDVVPPPLEEVHVAAQNENEDEDEDENEDEAPLPPPPPRCDDDEDEDEYIPPRPPAPPRGPSPTRETTLPTTIQLPKSAAAADDCYSAATLHQVKTLWSKAQAMGKKRDLIYDARGVCDSFEHKGWTIRTHKRGRTKSGDEPTTICDSYWISPNGKRFRSSKELDRAFS
jgi:hypothetical protein